MPMELAEEEKTKIRKCTMSVSNRLSYARQTTPPYAGEGDQQGVPPQTTYGRVQHGGVGLPEAAGQSDVGDGAPQVRGRPSRLQHATRLKKLRVSISYSSEASF